MQYFLILLLLPISNILAENASTRIQQQKILMQRYRQQLARRTHHSHSRNRNKLKHKYKVKDRSTLDLFHFPNTTLTHKIIGSDWDLPITNITDYYNVTYPLIPALNVTHLDQQELNEIVGENLVKSIDNYYNFDHRKSDLPLVFQHIYWPLLNNTSVIRAEAIHEYIHRKNFQERQAHPEKFPLPPANLSTFTLDFPPLNVDHVAQFMECEKHHFQFLVERNYDGTWRSEQTEARKTPSLEILRKNCKRQSKCFQNRYRTSNGKCTNSKKPLSGVSMLPLLRWLPSEYEDGLSKPKMTGLPNPRTVSKQLKIMENEEKQQMKTEPNTIFLMQWGQFTDHDLSLTLMAPRPIARNTEPILFCEDTCEHIEPCFGFQDAENITRFQNLEERHIHPRADCMDFVRSAEICGTGISSIMFDKNQTPREQINEISPFIDAGNLYGADAARGKYIREHNKVREFQGKLRSGTNIYKLDPEKRYTNANQTKPFLTYDVPFRTAMGAASSVLPMDCKREPFWEGQFEEDIPCFLAGDRRANIHLGLTIIHTLYTRMHNDFIDKLRAIQPEMPGPNLYHEIRRLTTFHMQQVIFERWLPIILGEKFPDYPGYNDDLEVGIYNEFATAVFRFGHTLIPSMFPRKGIDYSEHLEAWPMHKLMFSPYLLINEGGLDPILRGLISSPTKNNQGGKVSPELTESFFKKNEDVPLDLAALNIQRGRDHGLPGYGKYIQLCGLKPNLPENILALYDHDVNKVDLWVGIISEPNLPNAKIGALGKCLITKQFSLIRDGDKYWYEHQLNDEQITELRKFSLEKVICDYSDGIVKVPKDVFLVDSVENFEDCESLPELDLGKFIEPC